MTIRTTLPLLGMLLCSITSGCNFLFLSDDSTQSSGTAKYAKGPLICYYTFDDKETSAIDSSPNGINAPISGVSYVAGKSGNALRISGIDQTLKLPPCSYSANSMSIEFWLKLDEIQTYDSFIITGYPAFTLLLNSQGHIEVRLGTSAGVWSAYDMLSQWPTLIQSSTALQTNQWYHIAFTYNSIDSYLYINGTQDNYSSKIYNLNDYFKTNLPMYIGLMSNLGGDPFDGSIDEFKIYDSVRSSSEIMNDFMAFP